MTLYKRAYKNTKIVSKPNYCPRKEAIIHLDSLIHSLQKQNHAIILMLDANQTHWECFVNGSVCPHSMEWLRLRQGMEGPFITLTGHPPISTTQTPEWDIDFVLTYGITPDSISTIPLNNPATSDHIGIILDINLATHFDSKFSEIMQCNPNH